MIDLSDRFKHFEFDGTFYIHKACNTPVIKPIDYRLGVIFEIGRILEKIQYNYGKRIFSLAESSVISVNNISFKTTIPAQCFSINIRNNVLWNFE